jgi:hypothetical protein
MKYYERVKINVLVYIFLFTIFLTISLFILFVVNKNKSLIVSFIIITKLNLDRDTHSKSNPPAGQISNIEIMK